MLGALALFVAVSCSSPRAYAQVCAPLGITNNTACDLNICLYDAAGAVRCIFLAAGASGTMAAFDPIGAVSDGGTSYPFGPPPPLVGCTRCITLRGPNGLCCASVCFRAPSCEIRVNPCGPPCAP